MLRLISTTVGFLRVSGTRTWNPGNGSSARGFRSGRFLRTDSTQQDRGDQLDLDLWKSVMRSQGAAAEGLRAEEGDPSGPPDHSVLAATRDLVSAWRQAGKQVPDHITDEEVRSFAELSTKTSKKKYLKYLAIREGHKKSNAKRQEKRRSEREQSSSDQDLAHPRNSFLMSYREAWMDRLQGWRGLQALRFGQPLVFDMSYEAHMTPYELGNCVSQLMEVEGWNRRSLDPFHLHLCGLQPDGVLRRQLLSRYGASVWDRLLLTETPRRHLDLFPRDRLVYLTPDSPNVLRTFDPSTVYVVGALVDRSSQGGLSFAKAKRLQMATARLPLDQYLRWETGDKSLTLDQMIRILQTIKDTGSWAQAFEFVPKRKHDGFHQRTPQRDRGDRRGPARGDPGFAKSSSSWESGGSERGGPGQGGPSRGAGERQT
ncbi:hypothetical protein CRUP_017430 [Coryphaenoides rupestris]|nr:hypothetical protein CRUP_017430 [Coryphaenoides rupestris]